MQRATHHRQRRNHPPQGGPDAEPRGQIFLTTMDDYADMDAAYRDAVLPYPARGLAVKPCPSARVEISMIAANPETHHVLQEVSALPQPPQPLQEKQGDGLNLRMMQHQQNQLLRVLGLPDGDALPLVPMLGPAPSEPRQKRNWPFWPLASSESQQGRLPLTLRRNSCAPQMESVETEFPAVQVRRIKLVGVNSRLQIVSRLHITRCLPMTWMPPRAVTAWVTTLESRMANAFH